MKREPKDHHLDKTTKKNNFLFKEYKLSSIIDKILLT